MNLTPDELVARIGPLNKEVNNNREELLRAVAGMGICSDHAEEILATIDSAGFRASFQNTGLRHTTSFEDDPIFIAALKHFGYKRPTKRWWQFWK
jgi:hypothetical protein